MLCVLGGGAWREGAAGDNTHDLFKQHGCLI